MFIDAWLFDWVRTGRGDDERFCNMTVWVFCDNPYQMIVVIVTLNLL